MIRRTYFKAHYGIAVIYIVVGKMAFVIYRGGSVKALGSNNKFSNIESMVLT